MARATKGLDKLTAQIVVFRQLPQLEALIRNCGVASVRSMVNWLHSQGQLEGVKTITTADRDWAIAVIDGYPGVA